MEASRSLWSSPLMRQSFVISAILVVQLAQGMSLGFSSALLPALQAQDSPIAINLETSSWIVAYLSLGCVVCFPFSLFLLSTFGRRPTIMIDMVPGIIGCLLIYFANNVTSLISGRFLSGIAIGSSAVAAAISTGEYTAPAYRGVFLNLKNATLYVGCTIVHILGHYLHWRTVALINAVPYTLAFFIAYTWPESPSKLAEKKDFVRCVKTFYWLRGESQESTTELEEMIQVQRKRPAERTLFEGCVMFLRKFKRRDFLKPVFVYSFAAILIEASGRHVFPEYALQFISQMTADNSSTFFYTICIDLIITGSALISSIIVKPMKRRTLLFSSGVGSFLVLMAVCVYLFLQSIGFISKDSNMLPLLLFAIYFVIVNLGCIPICVTLTGELFPLEHRVISTCIAGALVSICLLIMSKITPFLLYSINVYGTFSVYGAFMAMSLLVLYFTLPETKDKTLQEIENYFSFGRYKIVTKDDEEANDTMLDDHLVRTD